jgi:MFS family permease
LALGITRPLSLLIASLQHSLGLYRSAFAERNIALLLGAGFASEIGDWFNTVALISLAFRYSDGATGVGGMLAVRMVTRLLLQGPAGTLVDRQAGRKLLFTSQLAMALFASLFALLVLFPALWLLFLLVILLEATNCIARPAFMVELRDEAPEDERAAANGALFASTTTAQLIGPLLGAIVLAPFGPAVVFLLNGATFLGVAFAVAQMRGGLSGRPAFAQCQQGAEVLSASDPEALPIGYRWLLRRQDLGLYALVSLSLALLVQATITLFVVRANTLGLGDSGVGIFYAAVAVGSIVGSIVAGASARFARPLFPAAMAMATCALALAVFGVVGSALLAIVALVVAGFATDFYEVVGLTYFQHAIPDMVYGRFFSIFLLALSAGGLIGALAGPTLEQLLGVGASLVALAAPAVTLALIFAFLAKSWHATWRTASG